MGTIRQSPNFGSYLWAGLAGYVLAVDVYALLTKKETLSDAFSRAISHPYRRWLVTLSWILTTKHLFMQGFLSWMDPFALIGHLVRIIQRILGGII